MEARNVIIGIVVLVLIVLGVVWFNRSRSTQQQVTALPSPSSAAQALENKFNVKIPENAEKIDLKVVSGEGIGAASRSFENGRFSQTVLSDLAEPANNEYYEAWLVKGNEGESDYSVLSLGRLMNQKGGYILDYQSSKDYSDHKRIVITRETKNDGQMETVVLEGSFK